ncbi:hypothetical protein JHW43_004268 [Diplocarpon mali]|nr:hypothetical protein JHW43_004268 [Diplocarpon mali]
MSFNPDSIPPETVPFLEDSSDGIWTPLYSSTCTFPPEVFRNVMLNLIRNPNLNSNHLFRADITLNCQFDSSVHIQCSILPRIRHFKDFVLKTVIVRTMIPRNKLVDKPLDQTCNVYEQVKESGEVISLVVYLPHLSSAPEAPFYHPAVQGIAFLHTSNPHGLQGTVSIHYWFFGSQPRSAKLERTALHLLQILHEHGQGSAKGYVKRVQHDLIIPQATFQNTYARLKATYARGLIKAWVETTDPGKHVFEDLSIAAFLMELWTQMYENKEFPGFVDIGCGNGLLVHILLEEGYSGWGFDARRRKSWSSWSSKTQESLKELILIPSIIHTVQNSTTRMTKTENGITLDTTSTTGDESRLTCTLQETQITKTHDGIFPKGTFIISNHADELTPWTPILANISKSPFMMIPCCSHALSGSRFRALPPKDPGASTSTYASLVAWVANLARECGWEVEKEMLRIPSTRNVALIGRRRTISFDSIDVRDLVRNHGGATGWESNAMNLVKGAVKGH